MEMEVELQNQLVWQFRKTAAKARAAREEGRSISYARLLNRLQHMQAVYELAFPDAKA